MIPDTDAGLVEFFLDTEAREIEIEVGRLRPRLNEAFFNHISREIAQIKFAVTRTAVRCPQPAKLTSLVKRKCISTDSSLCTVPQEMEDRLIELEAMQKVLLEGVGQLIND